MVSPRHKRVVDRALEPLAQWLGRAGVTPLMLTLATPIAGSAVCLLFVKTRAVVPFCLAMTALGLFDALDGAVARATHRVSRFGAYLDAVCDRYVDAMVICAAAAVTGHWALSMAVLAGAMLVSYTKARAAMEAPVTNSEWPDLMERTERSLLFMGGLAASVVFPWRPLGKDLFWWTLVVLGVLIHVTVVQRILRARRYILERAPS